MRIDTLFLDEFIDDAASHRGTFVSRNAKSAYLVEYYRSHGITIRAIIPSKLPANSGPTICWLPRTPDMEGYIIKVTEDNPYTAFKQLCLTAVVIAGEKENVDEYEQYSSRLDMLFKKFSHLKAYYERLLDVFSD